MPETFDAHYKWLGIPPEDQPPNHYRFLGISMFETDPDVIASAADQRMAHIRSFQTGQHSALSQKILNEIAAVRICLLNAAKKAEHDEYLRGQLAASEGQSQQTQAFDPAEMGIDLTARKVAPIAKQSRRSRPMKLPWQLPAAIGAGLLVSVVIIAYLIATKSRDGEKSGVQAKADSQPKKADEGAKSGEKKPPAPEPPMPKLQPKVAPTPDPKPDPKAEPEPRPAPTPEVKPDATPGPVVEVPENVAEHIQNSFAKAKTTADFKLVAEDALKLIEQSNAIGKPDVARSVVVLALTAARKADDDELEKTATLCVLEPGNKPVVAKTFSFDNRDATTADQRKPHLPVPDAAAQEQALKLIREVFKDRYHAATTSERRKAMTQELLQKAQATTDDTNAQYVMLEEAGRFAIHAKDADLAFQVIEEIATRFDADTFNLNNVPLNYWFSCSGVDPG
jgi:hypothetical protein